MPPREALAPFANETLLTNRWQRSPESFEIRLFDILRFSLYRLPSPEQGTRLNHKPYNSEPANSEPSSLAFEIRLFDILRFSIHRLPSQNQGKRLNHKPQNTEHANSEGGSSK